jgi:EAL and modified HD-GYP domain-containing signal transduction protein
VKIDMLGADPTELRDTVRRCRRHGHIQLIAERLETEDELRRAFELGFDFFQGHVLGRPHVVSRVGLSPGRMSRLQLVTALGDPDIDINRVVELIMHDPALSYRLLHATNSAASGLTSRVSSVRDAAVLLGLETVRKWVVLMLFSDLTDATEQQLTAAMTRARFCQLIAEERGLSGDAAFTVGLLSCIAELISEPAGALVADLPLTADVAAAVTTGAGGLGDVLQAVRSYEEGGVDDAARLLGAVPSERAGSVVNAYLSAIGWSTRLVDALPVEEASRRAMPRV